MSISFAGASSPLSDVLALKQKSGDKLGVRREARGARELPPKHGPGRLLHDHAQTQWSVLLSPSKRPLNLQDIS